MDPKPVDHTFHHAKLAYDQPPSRQPCWRVNMFFNKKAGISEEYFLHHWNHVHADLVTGATAFKASNILRYNQFFQSAASRAVGEAIGYGPAMDWDACTEFLVVSVEDFVAFTKSQEYIDATREFLFRASPFLLLLLPFRPSLTNSRCEQLCQRRHGHPHYGRLRHAHLWRGAAWPGQGRRPEERPVIVQSSCPNVSVVHVMHFVLCSARFPCD